MSNLSNFACTNKVIFSPLQGIILGQAISDHNNQMIPLSELLLPLNEASFRKRQLLKLSRPMLLKPGVNAMNIHKYCFIKHIQYIHIHIQYIHSIEFCKYSYILSVDSHNITHKTFIASTPGVGTHLCVASQKL